MPPVPILRHVTNYASAGMISALVGVVSFPIMTRNLSVGDYGIIGLITASTTLAVAFGKLGIQHAIVRYYPEAMLEKRGNSLLAFHTTVFTLFTTLSFLVLGLWLLAGDWLVPRFIKDPNITTYFTIVSLFIVLRMLGSVNMNLLRARQHSAEVGRSTIIGRCTYLLLILALLALDRFNLYVLLAAFVLAEAAAVLYATRAYQPFVSFDLSQYSTPLTRKLLRFGLPLMVLESLTLLLRIIDRYMIGSFLGEKQLGLYAASYNLSSYIEIVITASLAAAIRPLYTQIWESDGKPATQQFLKNALHIYLMAGIPFTVLFILVAPDVLTFLASERYEAGTAIIPYIATLILIDGALIFLTAGQYFIGSTNTILFWGIVAGLVNLIGNYVVIPRIGIEGAAATTLFAFVVFSAGVLNRSLRLLMFDISWRGPLSILLLSLVLYFVISPMDFGSSLYNLLVKGSLAGSLLLTLLLLLDAQVRGWAATTVLGQFSRRS